MIGREDEAVELFERLLALPNELGLLSEEYDPLAGRLVGNFPQAFSHVSLINSAFRLSGSDPLATVSEDSAATADELVQPVVAGLPAHEAARTRKDGGETPRGFNLADHRPRTGRKGRDA